MSYSIENLFPEDDKKDKKTYNITDLFPEDEDEVVQQPSPKVDEDLPEYAMEYTSPWEYLKGVGQTLEALTRGAVAGVGGFAGDIESLGRMVVGSDSETLLPTSEDVKQGVNYIIGEQEADQLDSEGVEALQFMGGVLAPIGGTAKAATKTAKVVKDRAVQVAKVKEALQDPVLRYSDELAKVKLDSQGKVVKDRVGIELVNKDVNPTTVSYVTNTDSKATKKGMSEILKRSKTGARNPDALAKYPPTEIIGKSVVNRLSTLGKLRKSYGEKLSKVVDTELSGINFPVSELSESFAKGVVKTFDAPVSKLPISTQRNIKELNSLIQAQSSNGFLTGKEMHSLKKILDDFRDVGAKDNMSRAVDSAIGGLRKFVNTQLQEASSSYRGINQKLSSILDVESDFKRLDPTRKFEASTELYNYVGSTMRNIGNTGTPLNSQWVASLGKLDDVLGQMGVRFSDDPVTLSNFAVKAKEFSNVNNALILKYGSRKAKDSVLKAAGAGGIGNTYGAVNNVANLVNAGIAKSDAKTVIKNHEKAYNLMMEQLSKQ